MLVAATLLSLMLCSCKVNWFGSSYDVAWYYVAIPVLLILVVCYIILISGTYICPECKTEFKPKWYQISVCFHVGSKRILKCPNCNRKGFCERKRRGYNENRTD